MNWKTWLQSLASAAISSAAMGATTYMQSGSMSGKQIGLSAGVGGLIGVLNYLMKSPLQPTPPATPVK
jgi:hypothetical protein